MTMTANMIIAMKNVYYDRAWGISTGTIWNKSSMIQIMADAAYATRLCHYMASQNFNGINDNDIIYHIYKDILRKTVYEIDVYRIKCVTEGLHI